ncbi:MAG TPA: hypothetical protein VLB51_13700 [Methylomirabilota bacterium]|nr:hypothetical protein [Methylomirabilota bacterium]
MKLKNLVAIAGILSLASVAGAAGIDVLPSAALAGTNYGLAVSMDGTTQNAYVKDDTPDRETIYRAQFWIDVNTWDGIDGDWLFVSRTADETIWYAPYQVLMNKKSGLWRIWLRAQNNTGVVRFTNRINLQPGSPSLLQIEWVQGDTPGTLSGEVTLSVIDGYGAGASVSTGLNNSMIFCDSVTLGAMQPKATQTGVYYVDEFASFRTLAP